MYKHCTFISEIGAVADRALQGDQTRLGMSQVPAAQSPIDIPSHGHTLHIQRPSPVYTAPPLLPRPPVYTTVPVLQTPIQTPLTYGESTQKQSSLHSNQIVTVLRIKNQ